MSELEENSPVAMTTINPSNTSEWQLYRVLQRANLLQYYDVFIAQGGDDVQQLCEAGEEEFLEIMALVGMASKPLHVRRLQKSLQEWVTNPAAFQGPMIPMGSSSPAPGSISATVREQALPYPGIHSSSVVTAPTWTPQMPPASVSPANSCGSSGASPKSDLKNDGVGLGMMPLYHPQDAMSEGMPVLKAQSTSPVPTPVLVESQIQGIADSAERLAKELPPFDGKGLNLKKSINREIQAVMNMTEDDPSRMDQLRKYAKIYGRFDSKRKNDKPMSLHEISVNEASAQLCKHIPALLTRREDLFPLARQVVRDSGYQYSKGHSRGSNELPSSKKLKLDPVFLRLYQNSQKTIKAEMDNLQREQSMSEIHSELAQISTHQEDIKATVEVAKEAKDYTAVHNLQAELENLSARQVQLLTEQNDLIVKQRKYDRYLQIISKSSGNHFYGTEDDFGDSSNLPSGASSPQNSLHEGDDPDTSRSEVQHLYSLSANGSAQEKKQLVKETLFDEGLRIAQQYGMADFAEELKELQQHQVEDEEEEGGNHGNNASEAGENSLEKSFNVEDGEENVSGVWPTGEVSDDDSGSNDSSAMSGHSSALLISTAGSSRANGLDTSVTDTSSNGKDNNSLVGLGQSEMAQNDNKDHSTCSSQSDTNGYSHKESVHSESNSAHEDLSWPQATSESVSPFSTSAKPLPFPTMDGLPAYAKVTAAIAE